MKNITLSQWHKLSISTTLRLKLKYSVVAAELYITNCFVLSGEKEEQLLAIYNNHHSFQLTLTINEMSEISVLNCSLLKYSIWEIHQRITADIKTNMVQKYHQCSNFFIIIITLNIRYSREMQCKNMHSSSYYY